MDEEEDDFKPYTEKRAAELSDAVSTLIEKLKEHEQTLRPMHGGSSESMKRFQINHEVEESIAKWNDAVFEFTGTTPVSLNRRNQDDDDEDFEDEEDGAVLAPKILSQISVVSRWDINILDEVAFYAAARKAHMHNRPEETEEDANVAIANPGSALYAISHDFGNPWTNIDGTHLHRGMALYITPDEPFVPNSMDYDEDDETDVRDNVAVPEGDVVYGEGWQ